MKTIMILGASILQLPAIKKAKEMGLNVVVVDMNPNAIGFKEKNIEKEVISTIDIPAVLKAAKRHKIDGIMTLASDMPMRTVAAVAKEMDLIGIDQETAIKATNKAKMREILKKHAVPIPMYFNVSSKEDFFNAVNKIKKAGYKCIIKPVDNSGSRGIDLLKNFDDKTIYEAYTYSKRFSQSGDLMVEEFMEGPEVSVETLTIDGICHVIQITDKITTGAPYFVEMGHSQPSQFTNDIKEKIKMVAIAANKAIGIKNGPSHTEIKITEDGPKIVEIGARLGGDNIATHLIPLSTGIDMVECCIKITLGETFNLEKKISTGAAIKYFNQCEGFIKKIEGIEEASKLKGVQQIGIVHGIGENISEINNSGSRMGFVIAQGSNCDEAKIICEKAISKIKITIGDKI